MPAVPASAQDWPTHPLTLVVPWAAGGGTDVMGRIMAHRMTEILGQPVIVENISGAGGMVGSAHVVRAEPDGYTFVFGSRSDAINMTLYKHPLYNFQNDLAPVVLVADQPTVLVARKDLPADGLKDFIAYVKKNQSTIKLGSAGVVLPAASIARCSTASGSASHSGDSVSRQRPGDAGPDRGPLRLFLHHQRFGGGTAAEQAGQGHRRVQA